MFIYNITINISEDAHQLWLEWMKGTHIKDVMKTGCFIENKILKLMYVEDEGHTYSVQYTFLKMADIEKYQKEFAPSLQADHKKLFGEKYTAFRTVLEIIA